MSLFHINIVTLKQVVHKTGRYALDECTLDTPRGCFLLLRDVLDLGAEAVEKFGIIALNSKLKATGVHVVSVGGLNHTFVEPREVFQAALLNNAHSIIAFHNHPSGDPKPSVEDVSITRRLREAGRLLGIEVLDHIVVGNEGFVSMKEEGAM
jgi:DNA repair protein RadC